MFLVSSTLCRILCSVDRASWYNSAKKNQLDAQLILSIFRQPLQVSSVSRPIIRRYNRMDRAFGTYLVHFHMTVSCPGWVGTPIPFIWLSVVVVGLEIQFNLYDCLLSWLDWNNQTRTTDSFLKRIINTNFCVLTVLPPDDGPRYARNT
jgi:hypothetical protein